MFSIMQRLGADAKAGRRCKCWAQMQRLGADANAGLIRVAKPVFAFFSQIAAKSTYNRCNREILAAHFSAIFSSRVAVRGQVKRIFYM